MNMISGKKLAEHINEFLAGLENDRTNQGAGKYSTWKMTDEISWLENGRPSHLHASMPLPIL